MKSYSGWTSLKKIEEKNLAVIRGQLVLRNDLLEYIAENFPRHRLS